jgi:hypothetical protein
VTPRGSQFAVIRSSSSRIIARPLDHVAQFPHVAGPLEAAENLRRFGRDTADALPERFVEVFDARKSISPSS